MVSGCAAGKGAEPVTVTLEASTMGENEPDRWPLQYSTKSPGFRLVEIPSVKTEMPAESSWAKK